MCAMSSNVLPENFVLAGKHVALAFLERSDAEELLHLVNASRNSLGRWLPWVENFHTLQDAVTSIAAYDMQQKLGNGGAFGIRCLEDGALAGEFILQWVDPRNLSASLGYFLGSEFEGKGLALESGRLVLKYLKELGIHRVEISAATGNAKSNALAERLGFRKEGVAVDAEFLHGKFLDHNRWAFIFDSNPRFGYECKH